MSSKLFDLKTVGGCRDVFLAASLFCYTITQADLDPFRPLYWLSLIMFFYFSLIERLHSRGRNKKVSFAPFLIWVICIVGVCAASQYWALYPEAVTSSQYRMNCGYAALVLSGLVMSVRSRADLFKVMDVYIVAACAISVFLIAAQLFSGEWGRLGDAFNIVPNGPAMQMGFALMFCFVRIGLTGENKTRYIACLICLAVSIVATDSRKIMLAAFAAVVLFVCYHHRGFFDMRRLLMMVPIGLACVLAVILVPFLNETIGYRLVGVFTGMLSDGSVDMSSLERDYYRSTAMQLFSRNPVFGIGFEGFAAYLESIGYWHVAYSHCNYTELLSNIGIFGLMLYYSMYAVIAIRCLLRARFESFITASVLFIIIIRLVVEYAQVVFIDVDNYVVLFILYGLAFIPRDKTPTPERKRRAITSEKSARRLAWQAR